MAWPVVAQDAESILREIPFNIIPGQTKEADVSKRGECINREQGRCLLYSIADDHFQVEMDQDGIVEQVLFLKSEGHYLPALWKESFQIDFYDESMNRAYDYRPNNPGERIWFQFHEFPGVEARNDFTEPEGFHHMILFVDGLQYWLIYELRSQFDPRLSTIKIREGYTATRDPDRAVISYFSNGSICSTVSFKDKGHHTEEGYNFWRYEEYILEVLWTDVTDPKATEKIGEFLEARYQDLYCDKYQDNPEGGLLQQFVHSNFRDALFEWVTIYELDIETLEDKNGTRIFPWIEYTTKPGSDYILIEDFKKQYREIRDELRELIDNYDEEAFFDY
jgi:hypothetical protein